MIEIKIIGRGGQGGKSAAAVLAHVALSTGKYVQSFPEYGAERQGAPVYAYTRISDEPIRMHSGVENPNIVAVIDSTLLSLPVTEGMDENGILIINTTHTPKEIRKHFPDYKGKVFTVDATGISVKNFGKNIPNTPMLGAINRAAGLFDQKLIEEEIIGKFGKKLSSDIIQRNIESLKEASENLQND